MPTCLGKNLFIRIALRVFYERLSIRVSFPFGFPVGMWDLIYQVLAPRL